MSDRRDPNTLPGFPKTDAPRIESTPVQAPGARVASTEPAMPREETTRAIGSAPTEIAMPRVTEVTMPRASLRSESLAAAEAAAEGSSRSTLLLEASGPVHWLADGGPVLATLGLTPAEVAADPAAWVSDEEYIKLLAAFRQLSDTPGKESTVTFTARGRDGVLVELVARGHNRFGEAAQLAVVHVSRREHSPTQVHAETVGEVTDRKSFLAHAQQVVARKAEKVWNAPAHARHVMRDRRWDYAMLVIYLDRFNVLLGGLGRDALADVCREAMSCVRQVLREGDVVAPIADTELGVVLERVSDASHVQRTVDLVLDELRRGFDAAGTRIALLPIAGIATSARRYTDAAALLQDAEAAAGRALLRGRGGHDAPMHATFETEFRTETLERMTLMSDFAKGIEAGELFLQYQPIVALDGGSPTALEAFVRWRHPELGVVMPGDFIPMAEETGLIKPLTEWVLAAGCRAMTTHAPSASLRLHVNIGGAELSHRGFFKSVMNALNEAQLAPERLCLDMSETALLDSGDAAYETMHKLGTKGVRFALDDYGTGASSLRYLADLPFDYVKIDTSLSQHVDDTKRRIVRAMIGLAHELDRRVIAEGVESDAQRSTLAALGSDEAQGYFFSKPKDEDVIFSELASS